MIPKQNANCSSNHFICFTFSSQMTFPHFMPKYSLLSVVI